MVALLFVRGQISGSSRSENGLSLDDFRAATKKVLTMDLAEQQKTGKLSGIRTDKWD